MLRNSEGKIMVARLGYFFAGEIIIGIILITLLIPTSLPATYFLLKFSRLTLSVTFNIFMYTIYICTLFMGNYKKLD